MTSTKKSVLLWLAAYVVLLVVGVVLFKTPNYSGEYLEKFHADHERYESIIKSEFFEAYEERPHLMPVPEALKEDVEFVEEYVARPEFVAEKHRRMGFQIYFRTVSTVAFFWIMSIFLKKPLLAFLDGAISEVRKMLDKSADALRQASEKKQAAKAQLEQWTRQQAEIKTQNETDIRHELAAVEEHARMMRAELDHETEDRKRAEALTAEDRIRREIVDESIRRLEERCRTESQEAKLKETVDEVVRLMGILS